MRTGFTQHREDLFDERLAQGRTFRTTYGVVSTPSSAVGTSMTDDFNALLKQAREATVERCCTVDHVVVTLDALALDEVSVLLFNGHTADEQVVVAIDRRLAALLLDSIATLDHDVVVEVDAWQVLSRSAR